MGAGRKTQTFVVNTGNTPTQNKPPTTNRHASSRNLYKDHLGGVIFGCDNNTMNECLTKQLFGLPAPHFSYVKNINPGLPLFLFNYSVRRLHGIFEAVSHGQMNINPYGWTADGSTRTSYPAQVQVRVRLQCQPLREEQFRPIIADNYYSDRHFWFELDHNQANKLTSALLPLAVAPSTSVPRRNIFPPLPSTVTKEESKTKPLDPEVKHVKRNWASDSSEDALSVDGVKSEEELLKPLAEEVKNSNHSSRKSDSVDDALSDEDWPLEASSDMKVTGHDEKDLVLKLKELTLNYESQNLSVPGRVHESTVMYDVPSVERVLAEETFAEEKTEESDCSSSHCQSIISKLIHEMEELKAFKAEQTLKTSHLEQKLGEAEMEIQRLKDKCLIVESLSDPSMSHIDETVIQPSDTLHLDPTESIFLVGGCDGQSWLSTLDSYFPLQDEIKSCKPMNTVRAYASVAKFNGELYVFGGGDGLVWYDTVESYSLADDQWTSRPFLNRKRGSLAGATMNGYIYAIGGGDGNESFSSVEMLDLDLGRWIHTRSMLQKRFTVAATELNGVLYATGGYDGKDYLNSAERFDPREHSWARIANMNSKRACHSLVVLNEKLYALGGYDGEAMVPTVEIYDPRLGSWMNGEPMKESRGYSAAAVVKESIYVIGGMKVDNIDSVECYKEGQGWKEINAKAIGKRSFSAAITL